MGDLKALRENQDALLYEETLLLRATPVHESIQQWLQLQAAFEYQLLQTEALFRQERLDALAELQERLARINKVST